MNALIYEILPDLPTKNELNKLNKWQQIHHFLQVFCSSCK